MNTPFELLLAKIDKEFGQEPLSTAQLIEAGEVARTMVMQGRDPHTAWALAKTRVAEG